MLYPVNQWIAAGKPVVSQDNITRRIKTCDIEVNRNNISQRELYGESNGLGNMRSGRAVKKPKLDRRNGFGREIMVLNKF